MTTRTITQKQEAKGIIKEEMNKDCDDSRCLAERIVFSLDRAGYFDSYIAKKLGEKDAS